MKTQRRKTMTTKEKAAKMRAMTDEELVAYVENRVAKAYSEGFNKNRKREFVTQNSVNNVHDAISELRGYVNDTLHPNVEYCYYCDIIDLVDYIDDLVEKI